MTAKGKKIVLISGIVLTVALASYFVYSGVRKRKVLKKIYEKLNDTTSGEGSQSLYSEKEQIKGSNAFDPNFWQKTSGTKPNASYFDNFSTTQARTIADSLKSKMANLWDYSDDESGIISDIKKLKSQGQVSLVSYVYSNPPKNYGNLSNDIVDALTGYTDSSSYIKEMNNYINSLPL